MGKVIAVIGSRTYPFTREEWDQLDAATQLETVAKGQALVEANLERLPSDWSIVSGGARGPDSWAVAAAEKLGLEYTVIHPDWEKYGRGAGFKRNKEIIAACDEVLAFWDMDSRGTNHSLKVAKKMRKPVYVIGPTGTPIFEITEHDYGDERRETMELP